MKIIFFPFKIPLMNHEDCETVSNSSTDDEWVTDFGIKTKDDEVNEINSILRFDGMMLEHAHEASKNNKQIVETAVKQNGMAFRFASDELKANEAVVKDLLKHSGFVLRFASKQIRDNDDVVMCAIAHNPGAIRFASKRIKKQHI